MEAFIKGCWRKKNRFRSEYIQNHSRHELMNIRYFVYTCSMIILVLTGFSACRSKTLVETTSRSLKVDTLTYHMKEKGRDTIRIITQRIDTATIKQEIYRSYEKERGDTLIHIEISRNDTVTVVTKEGKQQGESKRLEAAYWLSTLANVALALLIFVVSLKKSGK